MGALALKATGLAAMILAGYSLKRLRILTAADARVLSRIVICLTVPAALMNAFRNFTFRRDFLAVILFAAAFNALLLALSLAVTRGRDAATRALYGLNVPSYNIGTFVLPFVQNLLPPEALMGVCMFDAGNCPMNSGISYAIISALGAKEHIRLREVLARLAHSPPFMTFLTMMLLGGLGIQLPDVLFQIISPVASANSFLAMLMIGVLFEVRSPACERREVFRILALRYGCNLALCALVWLLPLSLLLRRIMVLSLLAPIPSVAMAFSERCGCKPSVYGVLNSVSIAVSLCLTFGLLLLWNFQ